MTLEEQLGFTPQDKANWLEMYAKHYADPEQGWREKLEMHANPKRSAAVYVMPGYQSPASGRWIETPRQRREDFKATGTREWEGMANERQHSERQKQYAEEKFDKALDHTVRSAWANLPEAKKQQALATAG
jgi:hypothetical protein